MHKVHCQVHVVRTSRMLLVIESLSKYLELINRQSWKFNIIFPVSGENYK